MNHFRYSHLVAFCRFIENESYPWALRRCYSSSTCKTNCFKAKKSTTKKTEIASFAFLMILRFHNNKNIQLKVQKNAAMDFRCALSKKTLWELELFVYPNWFCFKVGACMINAFGVCTVTVFFYDKISLQIDYDGAHSIIQSLEISFLMVFSSNIHCLMVFWDGLFFFLWVASKASCAGA